MVAEVEDLVATERTGTGKGAARQARRAGMVPGVVYGSNETPVAINIPFNALLKRLKAGHFKSTLFNLKVEGHKDVHVICRDVQRDVVKDLPVHVDFMRLHDNSKINLRIPVEVAGQESCPGLRKGGVLTMVRPVVELRVTAGDIPDHITIDISGSEIGDVITISKATLPAGVTPTIARDFVIANISAPSGLRSAGGEEGEEGEAEE